MDPSASGDATGTNGIITDQRMVDLYGKWVA